MKNLTDQLRQAMSQAVRIADNEWSAFEPFIRLKKLKDEKNLLLKVKFVAKLVLY